MVDIFRHGISIVRPEVFGRAFIPERWRLKLEDKVAKAGFRKQPYFFFGIFFYIILFATIILYLIAMPNFRAMIIHHEVHVQFILNFIFAVGFTAFFIIAAVLVGWIAFQYVLETRIYGRTKEIEAVLADYLRYVAENLRGGMSFEKSLWASVKPEFGVLAQEIELVTKKVMTGSTLDQALEEFTGKYDSPMVERTFDIIIEALKGGGTIADIIDDIVENLNQLKELKDELVTTNLSYTIFITAIVLFITPFMFALATQFILILGRVGEQVGGAMEDTPDAGGGLAISFSGAALEMEAFRNFALGVLFVNSLGAAVLTAIMNKGDWRQGGAKYLIFPAVSMLLYLVVSWGFSTMFEAFLPF